MADDNELASTRRDFREIAREEARAVYEELGAVDADGQEWTLRNLMENFNVDRRTALQAIGLIAVGYAAPTAVLHAVSGTARADSSGQIGTNTDPLTDVITDSVDAGTVTANQVGIANVVGKASLTADQTIPTGSVTQVNLDNIRIEDTSVVTVDLPNNEIDVDVAGTFLINAKVRWAPSANWSAGDLIQLNIGINNTNEALDQRQHPGGNEIQSQSCTTVLDLSANDTVRMVVEHNRGGDESLSAFNDAIYLDVIRIG